MLSNETDIGSDPQEGSGLISLDEAKKLTEGVDYMGLDAREFMKFMIVSIPYIKATSSSDITPDDVLAYINTIIKCHNSEHFQLEDVSTLLTLTTPPYSPVYEQMHAIYQELMDSKESNEALISTDAHNMLDSISSASESIM